MPSSATGGDLFRESFGRSLSPEHTEPEERHPGRAGGTALSGEGRGGDAGRPFANRSGPKLWSVVALSALGSAAAVAAVGCVCALIYPILRELRAERVRGEDGTEQRLLGFWSILVLSVLAGSICCVFSWTIAYLDRHQPGVALPTLLTLAPFRDVTGHGFHMGYGVAVLNGFMAMLTVIWSLI